MSALAGILHEKQTAPEMGQLIGSLADHIEASSVTTARTLFTIRRVIETTLCAHTCRN